MRHRDNMEGSTAPNANVVNRALAQYYRKPVNYKGGSTSLVSETHVYHDEYVARLFKPAIENASTALPYYFFVNNVYNLDHGEIYRNPLYPSLMEGLQRVETSWNFSEQLARSRKTLDKFKEEVAAWQQKLGERHAASLTRRIEHLFEDEPELGLKQVAPSLDSFSMLLAYLSHYPEFKTPSIGFNRDGTFSAIWSGDKRLRVTLDFISSSSIRWIFVDSRNGIKDAITGAGIVSPDILSGVLDVYGAICWMKV